MFNDRKEKRLENVANAKIVSNRMYNGVMCGAILGGLLINAIMCIACKDLAYQIVNSHPLAFLIGYFVCALAGIIISVKSTKPLISFIGYNMVVVPIGLTVVITVGTFSSVNPGVVSNAFITTTLIVALMTVLSLTFPEFFSRIGVVLFIALLATIIVELLMLLCGISGIGTSYIAAFVFSMYIGYDIGKSQQFPKTIDNAIDSALDLYLDIINLFVRLIAIFSRR